MSIFTIFASVFSTHKNNPVKRRRDGITLACSIPAAQFIKKLCTYKFKCFSQYTNVYKLKQTRVIPGIFTRKKHKNRFPQAKNRNYGLSRHPNEFCPLTRRREFAQTHLFLTSSGFIFSTLAMNSFALNCKSFVI